MSFLIVYAYSEIKKAKADFFVYFRFKEWS